MKVTRLHVKVRKNY